MSNNREGRNEFRKGGSIFNQYFHSVGRPFPKLVCKGSTDQVWKLKGRATSRFGQNLPPAESIQPENLSPFKPCTQQCRRQRKQSTDGKVINRKEQCTNRLYNWQPDLYAVPASIYGGVFFRIIIIGQTRNCTPSRNVILPTSICWSDMATNLC